MGSECLLVEERICYKPVRRLRVLGTDASTEFRIGDIVEDHLRQYISDL